jgi:hypothetical protein
MRFALAGRGCAQARDPRAWVAVLDPVFEGEALRVEDLRPCLTARRPVFRAPSLELYAPE